MAALVEDEEKLYHTYAITYNILISIRNDAEFQSGFPVTTILSTSESRELI